MAGFTGDDLELEFNHVAAVDITAVGGEIALTARPGPVRIRARVRRGEPVEVSLDKGRLSVRHEISRALLARLLDGASPEAVIEIAAPAETIVAVRAVSASVVAAGFTAAPTVATVTGPITVADVSGVTATTVSGGLEAQAVGGNLTVTSVSGDVTVSDSRLDAVTVKTVSGEITIDADAVGSATLNTVSGAVALRLPEDAAVSLEAVTVNGRLDCAFPLADSTSTKRRLSGSIGGGGQALRCRTVSGDVAVLRRRVVPA